MKKFAFNLQRILSLKERKEDMLKLELNRLFFKRNQHEHVKRHYETQMANELESWQAKPTFTAELYEQTQRFWQAIRGQIFNQQILIREYEIKIDAKRKEIEENRKEIKTLEKLKEKRWEDYQYEAALDERKFMDEIANRSVVMSR